MKMTEEKNGNLVKRIGIGVTIVFIAYLLAHHFFGTRVPQIPLPKVVVKAPVEALTVEYVTQTGTTVAYNSVDLVARIEGYLTQIKFTDGTYVKKGSPLFVIQPEPYLEQLKAAKATVDAQKAAFEYAKAEYARQQRMYKENATSLNNVEKWLAKMHESEAEVAKAIANQEIAEINYGYTHIFAPFDGRIGRHLVDVGNLVGHGQATDLATIEQVTPLYVYFNLNEIDLLKLRKAAMAEGITPANIHTIPVDVKMQNEDDFNHKATFNFVNTGLNASTGTLELRALLDNKDHLFVPGLFVQVRVAITKPTKHLTVPDTAIMYDQIGPYVLTMDDTNTVFLKRLTIGSAEKGMRTILKGLDLKDKVIVEGLQYATPGNKVNPQENVSIK